MAKIQQDETITADFLNRHEVVAEEFFRSKEMGQGKSPYYSPPTDRTVISARNESGVTVRLGEVLECDGSPLTAVDRTYPIVSAFTPDLTRSTFGVTLNAMTTNQIDEIQLTGVCVAKVNILDEAHKFASRANASRVLQSGAAGPVKIIFKPTGSTPPEERECIVQIGEEPGVQVVMARATAAPSTSYPSVTTWSEKDGSTGNEQVNVFPFEIVTPTGNHSLDYVSGPGSNSGTFVRAYNITTHFVPSGTVTLLTKVGSYYLANYTLPWIIPITLSGDILVSGYANATGHPFGGNIRVFDYYTPASKKFTAGAKGFATLRRVTGSGLACWRYCVSELDNCPVDA